MSVISQPQCKGISLSLICNTIPMLLCEKYSFLDINHENMGVMRVR